MRGGRRATQVSATMSVWPRSSAATLSARRGLPVNDHATPLRHRAAARRRDPARDAGPGALPRHRHAPRARATRCCCSTARKASGRRASRASAATAPNSPSSTGCARRRRSPISGSLFALLKRDATDLVVPKATELGAAVILPVLTARTNAGRVNQTRLYAIATEAAEQSERLTVPVLHPPAPLDRVLADWPAERRLAVAAERRDGAAAPPRPARCWSGRKAVSPGRSLTRCWRVPLLLRSRSARGSCGPRPPSSPGSRCCRRPLPSTRGRMSNPGEADATPITSVRQLADYIAAGCKPRGAVPDRHRAREIRLPPRRPARLRPTSPAASTPCSTASPPLAAGAASWTAAT